MKWLEEKNLRFKSKCHKVVTNEENRIVMSPSDNKRLQDFDKITTHQYETPAIMVCLSQLLSSENAHQILSDQ